VALHFSSVLADGKGLLVCSQHERNRSVTFLKASSDLGLFLRRGKSWQTTYFCLTGSITPFWVKQKVDFIVTRVKIMIRFRDEPNSNKRQTIG